MGLFEVKAVDRAFYEERLHDFLPERVIDVHTHVWLDEFKAAGPVGPKRTASWPELVARDNSLADLEETYRLLFPGKKVEPVMFPLLERGDDMEAANDYVSKAAVDRGYGALIFASPTWSGQEFERRIEEGGFRGAKVYLSLAYEAIRGDDIEIFDFLPREQLEVLDRRGWVVMLHIPRPGRLRDEVNLKQMMAIDREYPNAKVIIAHIGRAYCPEDVGLAWEQLSQTEHLYFDFSANTNAEVFRQALEAVGPGRMMFGSDLPITRMRMRRLCEQGNYVNVVPRGAYGDVSGDVHMREVSGAEAEKLTFFLYEEIDAFRRVADAVGLTHDQVEKVFYSNAKTLLEGAGPC